MRLSIAFLAALPLVFASRHHTQKRHTHHDAAKRNFEVGRRNSENVTSNELEKRDSFNGRGTFFYVGMGACGEFRVLAPVMSAADRFLPRILSPPSCSSA